MKRSTCAKHIAETGVFFYLYAFRHTHCNSNSVWIWKKASLIPFYGRFREIISAKEYHNKKQNK